MMMRQLGFSSLEQSFTSLICKEVHITFGGVLAENPGFLTQCDNFQWQGFSSIN